MSPPHDQLPTATGHVIMWLATFTLGAMFAWGAFGPLQIVGVLNSQSTAAWMQAIGALTGIGVAIAAPIWHARRIRAENDRHSLWLITALAARIADGFDQLVDIAELRVTAGSVEWFDTGVNEDLRLALESVAITSLPDDRLVHPIVALREIVRAGCTLSSLLKLSTSRAKSLDLDDARKLRDRANEEYGEIAEVYHERCGPFLRPNYVALPPGPHNAPSS